MSAAITVPTPGGANVGIAKFTLIAIGAAAGLVAYFQFVQSMLPDWANRPIVFGVGLTTVVAGGMAVLGGALAAMIAR